MQGNLEQGDDIMDLSTVVETIKSTLGEEETAKIGDSLANILSIEKANNDTIKEKDNTINKYKHDKEMLIEANGNMLRQQAMGKEEDPNFGEDELIRKQENKPFDYRTLFDEKGNLLRRK